MIEYRIHLFVDKECGFIPVNKASKVIEGIGGVHKYSALLEVKDGIREYTINALLDNDKKAKLGNWFSKCFDILQYRFDVLY